MSEQIAVSICIPAYKNIAFLKRLLDSIAIQRYEGYEVIVTDDSPDDSVKQLVSKYAFKQPFHYTKNNPALGTPENWNASIRMATGKWIKIMHNDDWFVSENSLAQFMRAAEKYPHHRFFFSAFQNVVEGSGQRFVWRCNFFDLLFLKLSPLHLFKRVYVGNPSCTLVKNEGELYDNRFKFVVDFEYYIRLIKKGYRYKYIDDLAINVGFHEGQVTKYTFLVPDVQLPENFVLLDKLGHSILRNPIVYDYFWRMFRNLKIRSIDGVQQYYEAPIPSILTKMISFQSAISPRLLKVGILSKLFMLVSYVFSWFTRVS